MSSKPYTNMHHPYPSRQTWLGFFDKSLLIIGAIAVVLAVVFFIAYNWSGMSKMAKFALVEGALIASIAGYALLAYQRHSKLAQQLLLVIASIITGSLLALFGQVYQTGADTWQLFFNWALFITPWVLIARLPALWLLWLGLLNLSLSLSASTAGFWLATHGLMGLDIGSVWLITAALLNMAALILWLIFIPSPAHIEHVQSTQDKLISSRLLNTGYHWSTYVVGAVATFYATRLGMFIVLDYGDTLSNSVTLLLWAGFVGYMYWRFRVKHIDILMLTYLCGSLVSVIMVWAADIFLRGFDIGGLFILKILLIGTSGAAVTWLRSVIKINNKSLAAHQSQPPSDISAETTVIDKNKDINAETDNDDSTPWYLHLFLGFSGLVSGALIIGLILLLFLEQLNNITLSGIGSILLIIAIVMFRQHRQYHSQPERQLPNQDPVAPQSQSSNTFVQSIAYSFSIAGQSLLGYAIFDSLPSASLSTTALLILQLVLFFLINDFLHRLLNAISALSCVLWLLAYFNVPEVSAALLALTLCVFSLQSNQFLQFIKPSQRSKAHSIFKPWAYASMLLLLTISVWFISAEHGEGISHNLSEFYYHYPLAQGLLIAVSLYATHLLLRRYHSGLNSKTGVIIASAVIVLGILSVYVSGLLATCLVIVIALANRQKGIMALATAALVVYVLWYYYQLDTTLLTKSVSMLTVGIAVLMIRWLLISNYFANQPHTLANQVQATNKEQR